MNSNVVRRRKPAPGERLRIIVSAWLVREPLAGMAWDHLQFVVGLAELGHDVYYLEDSGDSPSCMHPWSGVTDTDPTEGLRFTQEAFATMGIGDRWAYHDAHTQRWFGPCADRILSLCRTADLFLNVTAWVNPLRPWLLDIPVRVFFDSDPGFTQILHLTDPAARSRALQHTVFLSFGENMYRPKCGIPDDGLPWQATRQPVFLDAWPVTPGLAQGKFRTVMSWDSYGAQNHDDIFYGMKSDSFRVYMDLPRTAGPILEVTVHRIAPPVLKQLRDNGWSLVHPGEPSRDLKAFQAYIQNSKAEFSVAKHGYVVSRSGWFGQRSATYLASGRPVVLQDTGFSDWLPTGLGVIAFTNPDEALAGIEEVSSRYNLHCRAAREIACEYFDSQKVLSGVVESAITPSQPPAVDSQETR